MKEYLNKLTDGTYKLVVLSDVIDGHDGLIEIPEGAEIYIDLGFRNHSFYKDNFKLCWCGVSWENTVHNSMNLEHWNNTPVLWKRHTHPEELPFIDDEPKITTTKGDELDYIAKTHDMRDRYDGESDEDYRYQLEHYISRKEPSLNDQYAEIEQVRKEYKLKNDMNVVDYLNSLRFVDRKPNQTTINAMNEADTLFADADTSKHNHYFIDVSDVDEIDFYEIALRYNVTDPCIQHILKKCLAVGNRGHKDFHTDLKDIYDTAARALRIHGG